MAYKYKRKFRRKRKSIFRRRVFWDFVLGIIFIVAGAYLLFLSPFFELRKIEIIAPRGVLPVEIYNVCLTRLGGSLFLIKKSSLENEILTKFSAVKSVEIKKRFPHTMLLEIKERQAVGIFCPSSTSSNCHLIDETGVVFGGANSEMMPIIFSEKENINQRTVEKVLEIGEELEKRLAVKITKFILASQQRLNVETAEGWEIYFNVETDMKLALTKLKLLLEKEISPEERKNLQYIDLRFSKAYYR